MIHLKRDYDSIPETDSCDGCAFDGISPNCSELIFNHDDHIDCSHNGLIYIKKLNVINKHNRIKLKLGL